MYTVWTQHINDPKEKAEFLDYLKRSKPLFEIQRKLIDQALENMDKSELSIKDFDQPNWSEKQAWRNGHKAFAYLVKDLIDIDKQSRNYDRNTTE